MSRMPSRADQVHHAGGRRDAKAKTLTTTPRLPTLAECETAIGEPANAWAGRCYEISCKIVKAGLIDGGEAVYGHWVGPVHPESRFANRRGLPFVLHGWIQLEDGCVIDPTRWVFEHVEPYLYVGEPPDHWNIVPCANCGLLREEHKDDGPADQCGCYEREPWPYDEGGNQWRETMTHGRPPPAPKGRRKTMRFSVAVAQWVGGALREDDPFHLAANQLLHLANLSYEVIKNAVGPIGVKMIYTAIADFNDNSISWLPLDNFNRARRECGLERDY